MSNQSGKVFFSLRTLWTAALILFALSCSRFGYDLPGNGADGSDNEGVDAVNESDRNEAFDGGDGWEGGAAEGDPDAMESLPTDFDGPYCGNGLAEDAEACDLSDLRGVNCSLIGFPSGSVVCTNDCHLDFSGCSSCGNGTIDGRIGRAHV